jgi:predicted DNA-binding transcriptional regulator AlpA
MTQSSTTTLPQIMRLPAVMDAVGLSRPSIYRLMKERAFLAQVKLGMASVGWLRAEREAWRAEL